MAWPLNPRPAKSLVVLKQQVNTLFPERDRTSDGLLGDASHASRSSDHNPWVKDAKGVGIVTAWDCDADLSPTETVGVLVAALVAAKDARVKYLIHNGQMISSYPAHGFKAWEWRPYHGANAHKHHAHISVSSDPALYDDTHLWNIDLSTPAFKPVNPVAVREGSTGDIVSKIQNSLATRGYMTKGQIDGKFGPLTTKAVKAFQGEKGLRQDGIIGAATFAALNLDK